MKANHLESQWRNNLYFIVWHHQNCFQNLAAAAQISPTVERTAKTGATAVLYLLQHLYLWLQFTEDKVQKLWLALKMQWQLLHLRLRQLNRRRIQSQLHSWNAAIHLAGTVASLSKYHYNFNCVSLYKDSAYAFADRIHSIHPELSSVTARGCIVQIDADKPSKYQNLDYRISTLIFTSERIEILRFCLQNLVKSVTDLRTWSDNRSMMCLKALKQTTTTPMCLEISQTNGCLNTQKYNAENLMQKIADVLVKNTVTKLTTHGFNLRTTPVQVQIETVLTHVLSQSTPLATVNDESKTTGLFNSIQELLPLPQDRLRQLATATSCFNILPTIIKEDYYRYNSNKVFNINSSTQKYSDRIARSYYNSYEKNTNHFIINNLIT